VRVSQSQTWGLAPGLEGCLAPAGPLILSFSLRLPVLTSQPLGWQQLFFYPPALYSISYCMEARIQAGHNQIFTFLLHGVTLRDRDECSTRF
jgi:hypothetical protein